MNEVEIAYDIAEKAVKAKGKITAILASDEAQSERSVHCKFDEYESEIIFKTVMQVLKAREIVSKKK